MPDRDIIERLPASGWQRPYRLAMGGAPASGVRRAVLESLSRSLREGKGIPGFLRLVDIVEQFRAGGINQCDAFELLRGVERDQRGHRHTKLASRATAELLAEMEHRSLSIENAAEAVAEHCCLAMVDHHLFGRLRPVRLGEEPTEQCYKDELATGIKAVARQLTREPSGAGVRAPATRRAGNLTTEAMLHRPLQF